MSGGTDIATKETATIAPGLISSCEPRVPYWQVEYRNSKKAGKELPLVHRALVAMLYPVSSNCMCMCV